MTHKCLMSDDQDLTAYLKNHPRMTGVLFMLMMLLTQAGNAAAAVATTTGGP